MHSICISLIQPQEFTAENVLVGRMWFLCNHFREFFYVDPLLCGEVKALLKDLEFLCLIIISMINFLKLQNISLASGVPPITKVSTDREETFRFNIGTTF